MEKYSNRWNPIRPRESGGRHRQGANLSEGEKPEQDCGPRSRLLEEQKLEIQTQDAPGSHTGSCSDVEWRPITVKCLGTPLL